MFSPSPDHFRALATALTLQAVDDLRNWERIHAIHIDRDSRRHAYNDAMKAGKAALLWLTGRSPASAVSFADVCEIAGIDPADAQWKMLDRFDIDAIDALERATRLRKPKRVRSEANHLAVPSVASGAAVVPLSPSSVDCPA